MLSLKELQKQMKWKYFLIINKDGKEYSIKLLSDTETDAKNEAMMELGVFCGNCIDHTKLNASLKKKLVGIKKGENS